MKVNNIDSLKAEALKVLVDALKRDNLLSPQRLAAEKLGATQADISYAVNGNIERFRIDKIMGYLFKLGYEIEIKPTKKGWTFNIAKTL